MSMQVEINAKDFNVFLGAADKEGVPYHFVRSPSVNAATSKEVIELVVGDADWVGPTPLIRLYSNGRVQYFLDGVYTPGD